MKPILSFIGKSESGKTTLLGDVIAHLKQRGLKIAVIKHAQKFELDKQGKDSWQLSRMGADTVVVSSPEELAVMKKTEHSLTLQEIARLIDSDVDLILTEGFKKSSAMKIEVHRKEQGAGLLVPPEQLLAVVTDEPLNVKVPQFNRDDTKGLANLIEKWLQKQPKQEVEIFVNNSFVPLNIFVKDIIIKTIVGMISSLKSIGNINSLRISLRRKSWYYYFKINPSGLP
jgi:molybdopterin-guanine dinucleotide biosynthesis protein MobB